MPENAVDSLGAARYETTDMLAALDVEPAGPRGPFPRTPLADPLERRWLHYAFFSRDGERSLVANLAWLGADTDGPELSTAILLMHERGVGFRASEWNAQVDGAAWSSFRCPVARGERSAAEDFRVQSIAGWPEVALDLRRTSTPCSSQCATFSRSHWMRWQSEPGVLANGVWNVSGTEASNVQAVGYHERVRGRWGWPEMGGWVFGFCNDLGGEPDLPPPWSIVFTLLQSRDGARDHAASVMIWKDGRLRRHIPRRSLRVSVAGQLDRDRVEMQPRLASLLGTSPAPPIPAVLCIDGYQGSDRLSMRFYSSDAARLVIPSETSLSPFSVHEVLGVIETTVVLDGRSHTFEGPAVVEFAGGATGA